MIASFGGGHVKFCNRIHAMEDSVKGCTNSLTARCQKGGNWHNETKIGDLFRQIFGKLLTIGVSLGLGGETLVQILLAPGDISS